MTKIAIICGGPSIGERGISLNSARSIYDHLYEFEVDYTILYVDQALKFYHIEEHQLYSNTPSDFDFALSKSSRALTEQNCRALLQSCDIVFPAIHGEFGEDGQLQQMLEQLNVPFIGSGSSACRNALNKHSINRILRSHGRPALNMSLLPTNGETDLSEIIGAFLEPSGKAVIKPNVGGSSVGVALVSSVAEADAHLKDLRAMYNVKEVVIEEYCDPVEHKEFTVVLITDEAGKPVALPPTEVIGTGGIFSFRGKYLPTEEFRRPCPPETISQADTFRIQDAAEQVFTLFEMQDVARIDGFLRGDGILFFTDINPISGMEQNSFIFQQAGRIGWGHTDLLKHLINGSLERAGKQPLRHRAKSGTDKGQVWVLMGGDTAEKQVSVMSGTNVWLKLMQSDRYQPTPFLLKEGTVWQLPHAFCLDHTVSEIAANCERAETRAADVERVSDRVRTRLGIRTNDVYWPLPKRTTLDAFLEAAVDNNAIIFIALHGGMGEDGRLQEQLESRGLLYNGPGPSASKLCMDKLKTGETISQSRLRGVISAPKFQFAGTVDWIQRLDEQELWNQSKSHLDPVIKQNDICDVSTDTLLVKPRMDGCSAGIVQLRSTSELRNYLDHAGDREPAPSGLFIAHSKPVEMLFDPKDGILIEPFVETLQFKVDGPDLLVNGDDIRNVKHHGWIELTIGVVQKADGIEALPPSLTIADDSVLSLEEKFQGGTGVNLTPPPSEIVTSKQISLIQDRIVEVASALGITGYARIDVFFHTKENTMMVIEANTLPGLTPATVIYHQALAREPSLSPRAFLEHLVDPNQDGVSS